MVFSLTVTHLIEPAGASNPPASGKPCPKVAMAKTYNNKKYTCVRVKGKLVWSKGSKIEQLPKATPSKAPSNPVVPASPSPTPATTPAAPTPAPVKPAVLQIQTKRFASNFSSIAGSQFIFDDFLEIESNLDSIVVTAEIRGATGEFVVSGEARVAERSGLVSSWKIDFLGSKGLTPGKYVRVYIATSTDGQSAEFFRQDLTVNPPKYWLKESCDEKLETCPKILNETNIEPISKCKISDATPNGVSQGFPRPLQAKQGKSQLNVLVVPIEFQDIKFTETLITEYQKEFNTVSEMYLLQSFNRAKVNFITPDRNHWISLSETYGQFNSRIPDLSLKTQYLIDQVKEFNLSGYDTIFFNTSKKKDFYDGGGESRLYSSKFGSLENVYLIVGGDSSHYEHSLGHTLYSLEDLYAFDYYKRMDPKLESWPISFDTMGGGGNFIGWNRWLMGWLSDEEILCASAVPTEGVYRIVNLQSGTGKKLLVIPTNTTSAVIAEFRDDEYGNGKGVLVYTLDTTINHGQGPMKSGKDLLVIGESITYKDVEIKVIAASKDGVFVQVKSKSG